MRQIRRSLGSTVAVVLLLALATACSSRGGANDPILRLSAAESLAEGKRLFER